MMNLFQVPPHTRFDLRFQLGGIPVRVHPLFWLTTLLFGINSGLIGLLIWIGVVFVSILVHELGHSLAMRYFGQLSRIVLYGGGGVAIPETQTWGRLQVGVALRRSQENLMLFAGPGAGFLLAALVLVLVVLTGGSVAFTPLPQALPAVGSWVVYEIVDSMLWVNVGWGLINLLPILPLDGGRIAQNVITALNVRDGFRKSYWLSTISAVAVALIGLIVLRSTYMPLFFGLLAYQSYQVLRK